MAEPVKKRATYADLLRVPPHLVAEIVDGELVTHPRPAPRHGVASSALGAKLSDSFQFGDGGPGGWVFIDEPELHLGADIVVPDIAGWRRERLTALPETPYLEMAPDWVCEVISASTESHDRTSKRRIYAAAGIGHLWLLDPRVRLLETFALAAGNWLLPRTFRDTEAVSAAPFDAISFPLGVLWPFDSPADDAPTGAP